MDRGDIISGAAFKAVVRAALVFLLVLVAMGLISIRTIDRLMTDQVRLRVVEMAESVSGMTSEDPDEGLVERVDAVIRSSLLWDVMCGVARRSWARNEHSVETATQFNNEYLGRAQITLPYVADDDLIDSVVR